MTTHGHAHARHFDAEKVAAALEVEAELASGIADEAIELCAAQGHDFERIVDLGCGPGVDSVRLALRFAGATVVAADGAEAMRARAAARAHQFGVAARVETRAVDLDGDLRPLGTCDLVWSGMAIHHAADEVATLRAIRGLLRPGGLVCLLERADPIAIRLAGDLGRPGIWGRVEAARARASATLPGAGHADRYASLLAAAGLDVRVERTLTDTVTASDDPATRRFVTAQLRAGARAVTDPADAAVLETAAEAGASGATVSSSRRLLIARPAD
jgi:trans-aconitate methyltransferase